MSTTIQRFVTLSVDAELSRSRVEVQRINASTYQRINASTYQHINASTF